MAGTCERKARRAKGNGTEGGRKRHMKEELDFAPCKNPAVTYDPHRCINVLTLPCAYLVQPYLEISSRDKAEGLVD